MKLNTLLKTIIGISILAVIVANVRQPSQNSDRKMASNTAKITNFKGNSGGTGVVLTSTPFISTVLTNAHVCGVVVYGGIVETDFAQGVVTSYKVSEVHDLCLITTNTRLGTTAEVAEEAPELYSSVTVTGHPKLLPTVITKGSVSGKEIINIMTGMRKCTEEDYKSGLGMVCAFLGGFPIIRTYQSQVISATIQPGSSGSAVYNEDGKIAGLVFAGAGSLSYGHIVPHAFVRHFLENELQKLADRTPLDNSANNLELSAEAKLEEACKNKTDTLTYEIVKDYCQYVDNNVIYK